MLVEPRLSSQWSKGEGEVSGFTLPTACPGVRGLESVIQTHISQESQHKAEKSPGKQAVAEVLPATECPAHRYEPHLDTKDLCRCATTKTRGGQKQQMDIHEVVPDRCEGSWVSCTPPVEVPHLFLTRQPKFLLA